MLTALLFSLLSFNGVEKTDSTNTSWLEKEWASANAINNFEIISEEQIHIVSSSGEVVHSFSKSAMENGKVSINKARAYQNADFMFSASGDDYYLISGYDIIALPAETYQYNSAD